MRSALAGDTIAAIATAPGTGGVGIVRVSGPRAQAIAASITGRQITARRACFSHFRDAQGETLDTGIALFFQGPHSFTGEDVLELQGHGGSAVLDLVLRECLRLGARAAEPGEFSQRAFLNDKLDLAQAEAIADLVTATTEAGVRSANRSLQGDFSRRINALIEDIVSLRVYVEAAIDFPDEEIDFLQDGAVRDRLKNLQQAVQEVLDTARQGKLLRDGMKLVIAGRPNAGKSSLLNALSGEDTAIVTAVAGTTRDVLREHIQIDGMPLHIVDTAGLRDSDDPVEQEGIIRAWREMDDADHLLLVIDAACENSAREEHANLQQLLEEKGSRTAVTIIHNKCDLSGQAPGLSQQDELTVVTLSARERQGLDILKTHLKQVMGFTGVEQHGFSARRRHIDALERSAALLAAAETQLAAGELLAQDLRDAHDTLGEITGVMSADELLGEIFSSFCIGK
ncbi:MAG: tRNA uridine-5-carboxymethylaminomethyl(34) synthesis GTPase MnmE [Halieaceae bacterium]|jgi:tRNA modification GTPase|nr:tRNA uridine-5-carboxymethylaminomethyl(34) synthesis GTPase MnmE [Halieaceae bacterium]